MLFKHRGSFTNAKNIFTNFINMKIEGAQVKSLTGAKLISVSTNDLYFTFYTHGKQYDLDEI
jgi:hypothetical protein